MKLRKLPLGEKLPPDQAEIPIKTFAMNEGWVTIRESDGLPPSARALVKMLQPLQNLNQAIMESSMRTIGGRGSSLDCEADG